MRCEAQPRSEARRTDVYVERAPEAATKQIAKRESPKVKGKSIVGMNLIETIDLKKTYSTGKNIETPALRGISLSIADKDFVVLAGPSGSGKSTLLHLMGALDTATQGAILFEGRDITNIDIHKLTTLRLHKIGFVFQAYNLISTLTALENAEYTMLLQGINRRTRRKKSIDTLQRVGLDDLIHRFPQEMSGGQQQRVAVARAIAAEPRVVMADEPTANLDSKTAESLLELMQELNMEKGITFIFSTHDPMIMNKAKRLIHLKDGKITPAA